ncbi:hypothetical protein CR513_03156, partial [Mucuna pruriens]
MVGVLKEGMMEDSSKDMKNYSPKTRIMMKQKKNLEQRLEGMGRDHKEGLDSVKRDIQSVNAKGEALSKEKEEQKAPPCMIVKIKVEQVFRCFDFNNRMKVKLVTLEFSGYALVWWNQVLNDVVRRRRPSVDTWTELRRELRERFISSYYTKDLYNKLQRLYPRCKSVEDYYKEVKMALMRAQVEESQ